MPKIKSIPCVILAGGKSSRMGENKALLAFGNQTLVLYQYKKMLEIFQDVYISCKQEIFCGLEARLLYETSDIFSPLIGIENAFAKLQSNDIFFISVDTPFLKPLSIEQLCLKVGEYDVVYPQVNEKSHYLMGLWNQRTYKYIKESIQKQEYKIGKLLQTLNVCCIKFEDELEFANLNTPQDYQKALKYLKVQNG